MFDIAREINKPPRPYIGQIGVYKKFCESKYKDIEEIKELHGIRDYFEDKDVITGIDKTYFEMLSVKFDELAENSERDIILAVSFYYYMIFLIRVKITNVYNLRC